MRFTIEYSPAAVDHLEGLSARQQRVVIESVSKQLSDQADVETRHRKRMRPNPLASWELRVGDLRVYYDIEATQMVVMVVAIGVKERNRVRIGGEVMDL